MTQHDLILTDTDLALIRAALRFWQDEMPAEIENVISYFDDPGDAKQFEPNQAERLIDILAACRIS